VRRVRRRRRAEPFLLFACDPPYRLILLDF
jgi:hypothetical protein